MAEPQPEEEHLETRDRETRRETFFFSSAPGGAAGGLGFGVSVMAATGRSGLCARLALSVFEIIDPQALCLELDLVGSLEGIEGPGDPLAGGETILEVFPCLEVVERLEGVISRVCA